MEILKHFNTWFWSDCFWLPPNITWKDVRNTDRVNYAQFHDLYIGFKIALPLLVLKYVLKRYIFSPIGCYLGLGTNTVKQIDIDVAENKVLERALCENAKIGHKEVQGLAKQLDWSESKVKRWVRRRLSRGQPSTFNTFEEEAWKLTFSLFWGVCYGLYALWDKPWLWDSKECFLNYPHHGITNDVWWLYMMEVGYYSLVTITHFTDTKTKDFLQKLVHHIVTMLLLILSWTCNLFRVGSLVMIIYEFINATLNAARIAKRVPNHLVANACYTVFTVACIISRLGLYPYRITYYTAYEAFLIFPDFPRVHYVFNSLLFALQILHVVWTWMTVKTALRAVSSKNTEVKVLRLGSEKSNDGSSEHEADAKDILPIKD